jgi:integrase
VAAAGLCRWNAEGEYQEFRMHDMRHTAISLWVAAGIDPVRIAKWAGHKSVAVVLDKYAHFRPQDDEPGLDVLGGWMTAAAAGGDIRPIR